jgi:hypothetical protein
VALSVTYYVSDSGNDGNTGTPVQNAWKTIARVNQQMLAPGDTVLFKGGATFDGTLYLDPVRGDTGTPGNPLKIGSYGTGPATINAGTGWGLNAGDVSWIEVSNLNFVGAGDHTNTGNGIWFANDLDGGAVLHHIYMDHVDVSGFGQHGIMIAAFNGPGFQDGGFQDVRVTYAKLHDNTEAGLYIAGDLTTGQVVQDVYVGHTEAYDNPGMLVGRLYKSGNGIVLSGVNGGIVERSVAHDNGAAGIVSVGIWAAYSNNVTFQYDEAYGQHDASLSDGAGFDLDGGVTNSVMQYNYSHDNDGGGYDLVDWQHEGNVNNTVRFNVSENNARNGRYGGICLFYDVKDVMIYNNTVYSSPTADGLKTPSDVYLEYWTGDGALFVNNIFETTGGVPLVNTGVVVGGTNLAFLGNDYYAADGKFVILYGGVAYSSLPAWESATFQEWLGAGLQVDPQLVAPGQGGTIDNPDQLNTLYAYELAPDSPLVGMGLDLKAYFGIDPGPVDYFGNLLSPSTGFAMGVFCPTT